MNEQRRGQCVTQAPNMLSTTNISLDIQLLECPLSVLSHENPDGDFSGTNRATGDPLVSKRPDFLGLFSHLRWSHGLDEVKRPEGPPTRSQCPEGP